ncbi:hypothetical protein ACUNWD_13240 [Sunxiuqinia sp. A32]|uniref:hypothetical protein n=1 Tax=Sunxiuqinia sp. A32 TaxID=3461496 RepID=UPI0040452755
MNNLPQKQTIRSLRVIYTALMLGVTSLLVIASVINMQVGPLADKDPYFENLLLAISTIMAIISVSSGLFIFNKRMLQTDSKDISEKLEIYRSAMIIRLATMEGSGFFFIICYALTGSSISITEVVIILAMMFYFFPSNNRLSSELNTDHRGVERN